MGSEEEKIEYTKKIIEKKYEFLKNLKIKDGLDLYNQYAKLRENLYEGVDLKNKENNDFILCIEFAHEFDVGYNWIKQRNNILPTKEIEFEGYKFYTVNNPDAHLKSLFGNYMAYPDKIGLGHNAYVKLSKNDKEVIEDLIKTLDIDIPGGKAK